MEFDGPHHFTLMASTEEDLKSIESGAKITPRVLGHTMLKYRLLKNKGWTVVRIPYYEFDKIPFWASMVSSTIDPCKHYLSSIFFNAITTRSLSKFDRNDSDISNAL